MGSCNTVTDQIPAHERKKFWITVYIDRFLLCLNQLRMHITVIRSRMDDQLYIVRESVRIIRRNPGDISRFQFLIGVEDLFDITAGHVCT